MLRRIHYRWHSFYNAHLDLGRMNVIIGDSGSGKSSILFSMKYLNQSELIRGKTEATFKDSLSNTIIHYYYDKFPRLRCLWIPGLPIEDFCENQGPIIGNCASWKSHHKHRVTKLVNDCGIDITHRQLWSDISVVSRNLQGYPQEDVFYLCGYHGDALPRLLYYGALYAFKNLLICIDSPETSLDPRYLGPLVQYFRETGHQYIFTTTSPTFLDHFGWDELTVLFNPKDRLIYQYRCSAFAPDGETIIYHPRECDLVSNLTKEGLPLGGLWISGYLDSINSATGIHNASTLREIRKIQNTIPMGRKQC